MKRVIKLFGLALALVSPVARAVYYADITSDGFAGEPGTGETLWLDSAHTTLAPGDRKIWFVADVDANGINTTPVEGAILSADDVLLYSSTVGVGGTGPGQYYSAGVGPISDVYSNKSIWVYLWNVSGSEGLAGQTFGTLNLGANPPPSGGGGSATWTIGNIAADVYTVAIPEPSTVALMGMGALVGFVALRRHRRK